MFKFNFDIEQNDKRESASVESIVNENENQSMPEAGFFYANDVQGRSSDLSDIVNLKGSLF